MHSTLDKTDLNWYWLEIGLGAVGLIFFIVGFFSGIWQLA